MYANKDLGIYNNGSIHVLHFITVSWIHADCIFLDPDHKIECLDPDHIIELNFWIWIHNNLILNRNIF